MRRRFSRSRQPAELTVPAASAAAADPVSAEATAAEPAPEPVPLPEPPAGASPDEVVAHWRDFVLREPGSVAARRRLAAVLEARGEAELAMEQLETARDAVPDDVGLIVELAQAQTALRRFDPAERDLRRALKLNPAHAGVHQALGVISLRRGLYAQAEQELRRSLDLDPDAGGAYFYRAEALNQLNRVDEALAMLERALQFDPANGRIFYLMGILYDKKSRPQEAGAMYRRAREVGGA
ncbi:MAG TPA: tetratricopeptide repeat protein [Longimicrobiales bacterium]|nr:tetratricopeptide repeat protein [Longimicrobiales bacterium]